MKFKVLAGQHIEDDPVLRTDDGRPLDKVYKKGDIVDSKAKLNHWPEKFARVIDGSDE